MDKELIERIALEVADELDEGDTEACVAFATRFLARIDDERGKDAVAWRYFDESGKQVLLNTKFFQNMEPLFLSPTISKCMALDAARYRWLRSSNVGDSQIWELLVHDGCLANMTLKSMAELDQAIDAAMLVTSNPSGE